VGFSAGVSFCAGVGFSAGVSFCAGVGFSARVHHSSSPVSGALLTGVHR
jgi:hypothetical protein